jgi:hypothetical protein
MGKAYCSDDVLSVHELGRPAKYSVMDARTAMQRVVGMTSRYDIGGTLNSYPSSISTLEGAANTSLSALRIGSCRLR